MTNQYHKDLGNVGMVMDAKWTDLNGDKKEDLVVATEWGPIVGFIQEGKEFRKVTLTEEHGLWGMLQPIDFDKDGDIDFIAGNQGSNARFQPSSKEPVNMYIYDFDQNKKQETVVTYFLDGQETIFPSKMELEKQIPGLKKKFLFAKDFASANVEQVLGAKSLAAANKKYINNAANSLIINKGNGQFYTVALPWEAQLSPYKTATIIDVNNDGFEDVLIGANYDDANVQLGRYDADFGTILLNENGKGFRPARTHNLPIKGQVRNIEPININGRKAYVLAKNNNPAQVISLDTTNK